VDYKANTLVIVTAFVHNVLFVLVPEKGRARIPEQPLFSGRMWLQLISCVLAGENSQLVLTYQLSRT